MADRFDYIDIRTVKLRVGIVLSSKSGALPKIMKPIKMGVGAALGSGNQYIPWIHIDDVCNMFVEAIENTSLEGVYNAVAPSHLTNKELTHEIALLLNKKILLPNVPSFMLYLIFGKMAEIFLNGSRVSSEKIINKGFQFKYQDIKMALNDLLTK